MKKVKRNILLNPGPATTTDSVKYSQVVPDICPREESFCGVLQYVADALAGFAGDKDEYAAVLFGGSGTAAVESVLSSVLKNEVLLIINNGAYGKRMCEIAEAYQLEWEEYKSSPTEGINIEDLKDFLEKSPRKFSFMAVVHNETTTGLLNDIEKIGTLCRSKNMKMIVDAMSSFGAVPVNMEKMNISYLAASSNKNLQAMAGISFVIARKSELESIKDKEANNYYLNLHAQYTFFKETSQMRFTPPVQTIYSLKQAIKELKDEGIQERYKRYCLLWETLIKGISELGLRHLVDEKEHSKIVTAILEPDCESFNFEEMHDYFLQSDITIYPGKIEELNSFRVANIGDLTVKDIQLFLKVLKQYLVKINYL